MLRLFLPRPASASSERTYVLAVSFTHALIHATELTYAALLFRIEEEFGSGLFLLGVLANVGAFAFGLGALPAGALVDRIGTVRVLRITLALSAAAAVVVGLSTGELMLGLALAFLGLATGALPSGGHHAAGAHRPPGAQPRPARDDRQSRHRGRPRDGRGRRGADRLARGLFPAGPSGRSGLAGDTSARYGRPQAGGARARRCAAGSGHDRGNAAVGRAHAVVPGLWGLRDERVDLPRQPHVPPRAHRGARIVHVLRLGGGGGRWIVDRARAPDRGGGLVCGRACGGAIRAREGGPGSDIAPGARPAPGQRRRRGDTDPRGDVLRVRELPVATGLRDAGGGIHAPPAVWGRRTA